MTKIRTLIVDDEALARERLRQLLVNEPEIELVGECADGQEALEVIRRQAPDLIFLDIQMPELDGFGVLEALNGPQPVIVFVTAYDKFALRAFEVHAVDYLLKPVGAERFEAALVRARLRVGTTATPEVNELAAAARPPGTYAERLVVKDGAKVQIIPVAKLDYVEAQDDYVALASQGKKHLKQQTIASLEACLDPNCFVRIHRSYIVNLERVARIEPYGKDSRLAILGDGARLPVSRTGYARLQSLLDERK